jgi:ABC-type cobalamin transport system permease subunit
LIIFIGAFLSASRVAPRFVSVVLFLGGVALGVMVDVIVDWAVFARDRNLFPLELAWWWLIGVMPVAFGVIVRHSLHRERQ